MKIISLFCTITLTLLCLCSCAQNAGVEAKVYYLDSEENNIVYENVSVSGAEIEDKVIKIIEKMKSSASNSAYKSAIPQDVKFNSVSVKNGVAIVDFSKDIYDCDRLTAVLLRAALVNSLTSVVGVNSVLITVNDEPYLENGNEVGAIHSTDVVTDVYGETTTTKHIKLYFSSGDGLFLVPEMREVVISDKESLELTVVKELLKGPSEDELTKTMPTETKILSVETKEGVCFVNLSQDFITKHTGGTAAEAVTVYSVVNSLIELENIEKVQFLIEGQKSELFIHMIFNEPFSRNDSYVEQ